MQDENIGLFDEKDAPEREPEEEKPAVPVMDGMGIDISSEEELVSVNGGKITPYHLKITNNHSKKENVKIRTNIIYDAQLKEDAPEWPVTLQIDEKVLNPREVEESETEVKPREEKDFIINISTPHGVRYGDRVDIVVTIRPDSNLLESSTVTISAVAKQTLFAVRTSRGHERNVADGISSRAKELDVDIFSVLSPSNLPGYIIVEAMNVDRLNDIVRGVRMARGLVLRETEMTFEDIYHYLTPKPLVHGISEGDIIELVAGPFKGEKARVQNIDETKEEITVELFEAVVPIPVTVKGDSVRVIEKEGKK